MPAPPRSPRPRSPGSMRAASCSTTASAGKARCCRRDDRARAGDATCSGRRRALSGIALPDAAGFAALRAAPATRRPGAPAAPWIHLLALTLAAASWCCRARCSPLVCAGPLRGARAALSAAARRAVLPAPAAPLQRGGAGAGRRLCRTRRTPSPQATLGLQRAARRGVRPARRAADRADRRASAPKTTRRSRRSGTDARAGAVRPERDAGGREPGPLRRAPARRAAGRRRARRAGRRGGVRAALRRPRRAPRAAPRSLARCGPRRSASARSSSTSKPRAPAAVEPALQAALRAAAPAARDDAGPAR